MVATLFKAVLRLGKVLVGGAALLYGGLINAYLWQYWRGQDDAVLVGHLNLVADWLLPGSIVLALVVLLVLRRARWVLLPWLLPGLMAFAGWYGENWLPNWPRQAEGIEVRVATFNAFQPDSDPEAILRAIDALDVDVVGIVEGSTELQRLLAGKRRDEYPYQTVAILAEIPNPPSPKGEALLLISRYPIVAREFVIKEDFTPLLKSPPIYLHVDLDVAGQRVQVYVFHPERPKFYFGKSIDDQVIQYYTASIVSVIEGVNAPVILLCDCNATPRTRQYRTLDRGLDEAFGERGWGFGSTYPASFPLVRIDYVWYNDFFRPLAAGVGRESGTSDHRPVWAKLDLRR